MQQSLRLLAPAKINWVLAVGGIRADGYHFLSSVLQSISLYDRLELAISSRDSCCCDRDIACGEQHNLALRAWLALKRSCGLRQSLSISIVKNIPSGAGLGGGSSDAAAVLLGANQLFNLGLSQEQLARLALPLGADIPFCLQGGLALVEGIGEIISPQPSPAPLTLLLAKPQQSLSTGDVFRGYDRLPAAAQPDIAAVLSALGRGDMAAWHQHTANMLEPAALSLSAQLQELRQALVSLGCRSLMSGSGTAVFAPLAAEQAMPISSALAEQGFWTQLVTTLDHGVRIVAD